MRVAPMPGGEELDRYYQSAYRTSDVSVPSSPYDDMSTENFRTLSQIDYIGKFTTSPESIVDVGCGSGALLRGLGKKYPGAQLFGVEISEYCFPSLAALQVSIAKTTLDKAGRNPFSKTFDLLTCSHVLEHSYAVPNFLSICHSMLREGGVAMFEVPNCEHSYGSDIPHLSFFVLNTLTACLAKAGFEIMDARRCGPAIDRWVPSPKQKLKHLLEDHLPRCAAALKDAVRLLESGSKRRKHIQRVVDAGFEGLKIEARDPDWFEYEKAGVRQIALRCAVRRHPA